MCGFACARVTAWFFFRSTDRDGDLRVGRDSNLHAGASCTSEKNRGSNRVAQTRKRVNRTRFAPSCGRWSFMASADNTLAIPYVARRYSPRLSCPIALIAFSLSLFTEPPRDGTCAASRCSLSLSLFCEALKSIFHTILPEFSTFNRTRWWEVSKIKSIDYLLIVKRWLG